MIASLCSALLLSAAIAAPTPTAPTGPQKWEAFVRDYTMSGFLGDWTATGVTADTFAGIKAGLPYTANESSRVAADGMTIVSNYTMSLQDGQILSTGTALICLDAKTGAIVRMASGYDGGEPYTGTAKLVSMEQGRIEWAYTEQSRGETREFRRTMTRKGPNQTLVEYRPLPDGEVFGYTQQRVNPLTAMLARMDMIGTWESQLPDGTINRTVHALAVGGRVVESKSYQIAADGTETMTSMGTMRWDAGRDTAVFTWTNAEGMCVFGELISLEERDGAAVMRCRHWGSDASGRASNSTTEQTLRGDVMTMMFTSMDVEGDDVKLPFVGVPFVSKRVK